MLDYIIPGVTTKETVLYNFIMNRKAHGRDTVIVVCGEQRNGKTRFALRMAYEIDGKSYNIKEQFFVNALECMEAFDKFSGKVLIYDEVGKDLDPFRAMDDVNRAVAHVLQSQAYKKNVLFVILPFITDLAKPLRKHLRCAVQMIGRGTYILYRPYINHADFNDSKIKKEEIERVGGIPLPPAFIENVYAEEFEGQTKKDIMTQELTRIKNKLAMKNSMAKYGFQVTGLQRKIVIPENHNVLKAQIPN